MQLSLTYFLSLFDLVSYIRKTRNYFKFYKNKKILDLSYRIPICLDYRSADGMRTPPAQEDDVEQCELCRTVLNGSSRLICESCFAAVDKSAGEPIRAPSPSAVHRQRRRLPSTQSRRRRRDSPHSPAKRQNLGSPQPSTSAGIYNSELFLRLLSVLRILQSCS